MKNRVIYFYIIITIYIAFLSFQFMQNENFNLKIHEYSAIVLQTSIILIFIELLILTIYVFKNYKKLKLLKMKKSEKIIALLVSISIIILLVITFIQLNYKESGGIFTNIEKIQINDKYYVILDGKHIYCTLNEYNLIEADRKYIIKYKWNTIINNNTKLLRIRHTK